MFAFEPTLTPGCTNEVDCRVIAPPTWFPVPPASAAAAAAGAVLGVDRAARVDDQVVPDVEAHRAAALAAGVVDAQDGTVDDQIAADGEDAVDHMVVVVHRAVEATEVDGAADRHVARECRNREQEQGHCNREQKNAT